MTIWVAEGGRASPVNKQLSKLSWFQTKPSVAVSRGDVRNLLVFFLTEALQPRPTKDHQIFDV